MSIVEFSPALWQTGLYGKLPSQGDFVTRRLPQDFVRPWDDWLQLGMSESRSRLGETWKQAYQGAPTWRFAIAPGECGPAAWAGVLQPSADRVGRYFPLTVAARLADDFDPVMTLMQCAAWHESIEQAAQTALDAAITIEALDRRIESIAFPPDCLVYSEFSSEDTLPIGAKAFSALRIQVEAGDSPQTLHQLLHLKFLALDSARCAWLTRGNPAVGPALLVAKSLPSPRQFCALLEGQWEEHGWEVVDRPKQRRKHERRSGQPGNG